MRSNPVPAGPFGPQDFGSAPFGTSPFNPFGPQASGREERRASRPSREERALHRAMHQAFRAAMSTHDTQDTADNADADSTDNTSGAGDTPDQPDERGERGERRSRGGRGGHEHHGGGRGRRGSRGEFGGPGFGGPGGPFGRGPRAGRGDIRAGVLALLAEQPRHGYEIITELADRSGGVWRPSPGSIYPTLKQLHHEGLVTAEKSEGRRVFSLTDAGRAYVEEHAAELAAPWDAVGNEVDDAAVQLRDLTQQMGAAVVQVAQAGTPEQIAAAAALLTQTRRALYRILAEDPTPTPTDA